MRFLLYALLAASIPFSGSGQYAPSVAYPKGYFRNPLAIPMDLSGNFGELRPNHYHMGLDLKTLARENQPIYAAADGYISRIKIEPAGFGRAIYITHPNGFTTLYAHLNDFSPAIDKWLKEQQYARESWRLELTLSPDLFPLKKGDFIAYSGNTGGSQAPHLHFEIRRTADDVNVNPMLFGFPLADNTQPRILRLAIYNRQKSIYEQSPVLVAVKPAGAGKYVTAPPVIKVSSPKISLAMTSFDTHTGSSNLNGIYEGELQANNESVVMFRMDQISYNDTRYLNAHIDYKTKASGGSFLQHFSELPGYINSIYQHGTGNGVLEFMDGEIKDIRLIVRDSYGNSSTLQTKIQYIKSGAAPAPMPGAKMFYPLMLDGFESSDCEFYIGERCLYDSVHVRYNRMPATSPLSASALHAIGQSYIPLQEVFLVRLKATRALTETEKQKTVMQWYAGSKKDVQKVDWQQDFASARFRDFGFYQLLIDNTPPEIVVGFADGANLSKATRILFTVKDNLDKFKNVRAELDGKWLRFTNDKGRNFIYRFDEKCLSGSHELKITAEDEAGNKVEKKVRFVR